MFYKEISKAKTSTSANSDAKKFKQFLIIKVLNLVKIPLVGKEMAAISCSTILTPKSVYFTSYCGKSAVLREHSCKSYGKVSFGMLNNGMSGIRIIVHSVQINMSDLQ